MKKIINTDMAPTAIGPYVQAVITNGLLITSGQLPINPETGEMPEGPAAQAKQSLANVKAIVEEANMSVENIKKMTVFVKNLNDFAAVNAVYQQFFDDNNAGYPARSCVEVARLPKDALVEIEALATTD